MNNLKARRNSWSVKLAFRRGGLAVSGTVEWLDEGLTGYLGTFSHSLGGGGGGGGGGRRFRWARVKARADALTGLCPPPGWTRPGLSEEEGEWKEMMLRSARQGVRS